MRSKRLSLPTACSMRARALYEYGLSIAFDLWDDRTDAAFAGAIAIGFCIVSLIRDGSAGRDVGSEIEKNFEVATLKRSSGPVHEMKSCAGWVPQGNGRKAVVGRRVVLVKPSLHVLARGGTLIDSAGHLAQITRFCDRRFWNRKHLADVSQDRLSKVALGGTAPCKK